MLLWIPLGGYVFAALVLFVSILRPGLSKASRNLGRRLHLDEKIAYTLGAALCSLLWGLFALYTLVSGRFSEKE